MPVIPGGNGSQVLNPGSPVPIDSSAEKRLVGDNISGFGKAMAYLGNVLDDAGKKAKAEENRLTVLNAENEANMKLLERRAKHKEQPTLPGDSSGYKAVENFAAEFDTDVKDIAEKIQDPAARAEFIARSGKLKYENANEVWATEVTKIGKNSNLLRDKLVANSGKIVMGDPSKLGIEKTKTSQMIYESNQIPDAEKPEYEKQVHRGLIKDAIQGRINFQTRDWKGAVKILQENGEAFTPEERAKQIDEIQNTQWNWENREAKRESAARARTTWEINEPQRRMKDFLNKAMAANPIEAAADADQAVAAGKLSPAQRDAIVNPKKLTPQEDNQYAAEVIKKAVAGGNIDELVHNAGMDTGIKVSGSGGAALQESLRGLQKRMDKDPSFAMQVQRTEKTLEAFVSESATAGMTKAEIRQLEEQVFSAKNQFYGMIAKDPQAEPGAVVGAIAQTAFTYEYKNPDAKAASSLADVKKMQTEVMKARASRKLKNQQSAEQEQKDTIKFRELQRRSLELSLGVRSK